MFGWAAGRILSFVVDGLPSPLLIVYCLLEIVMASWGVWILGRRGSATTPSA